MNRELVIAVGLAASVWACGTGANEESATGGDKQTVASLIAAPPAKSGASVSLDDVVVIVSQRNGQKWRAYVQDPGSAAALGIFCDAGDSSSPCTTPIVTSGKTARLEGEWTPNAASQITPTSFLETGPAKITYASFSAKDIVAKSVASGTPAHLTGGPWVVADAAPAMMKNPGYSEADCQNGPPYFGVQVTDTSDGSTIGVVVKWFESVSFTTGEGACAGSRRTLKKGDRFTRLGGLIETGGGGESLVLEPFSDADWEIAGK